MSNNEYLEGCLILATERLEGSYFEDALILIAIDDENGSFGLMINRPTHMPIHEVFDPVPNVDIGERPFFIGGPVDEEGLHIVTLFDSDIPGNNGIIIEPGVELGGEWGSVDEILSSDENKTFLFLGYSGWDAGQLNGEIAEGSWDVYKCELKPFLKTWFKENDYSSKNAKKIIENLNNC